MSNTARIVAIVLFVLAVIAGVVGGDVIGGFIGGLVWIGLVALVDLVIRKLRPTTT